MSYWKICVEEALSEIGISATPEQEAKLVRWIKGAHDTYGESNGFDQIPNPEVIEIGRLNRALKSEQELVQCKECGGRGTIIGYGPCHSSVSQCDKCRGRGRHQP